MIIVGLIFGGILGWFFVAFILDSMFAFGAPTWLYLLGIIIGALSCAGNALGDKEKENREQEQVNLLREIKDTSNEKTEQNIDIVKVLSEYKQLLDQGILTQEEFDIKKKQILN